MAEPTQFPHSSPETLQQTSSLNEPSATKVSKSEANYRNSGASTTRCSNCAFYRSGSGGGSGTCSKVSGTISPEGVSDLYKARAKGLGDLISTPKES